MKHLVEALDRSPEDVRRTLGQGALLRMKELKKLRKSLIAADFPTEDLDAEIDLLKGTKQTQGLFQMLDVKEEPKKKAGKAEPAPDPAQMDIEDAFAERDYRTHSMSNVGQLQELISNEISEKAPAAAVRALNALEDGENERDGGPRITYLRIIRDARAPLAKKVDSLGHAQTNGDSEGVN